MAWGLTFWSAAFNAFALLVLSGVIRSEILYFVVLMFRVPCAAFLLNHGCFFALGIWLFTSANRKLTRPRMARRDRSGSVRVCGNLLFRLLRSDQYPRDLRSVALRAGRRLGRFGVADCRCRVQSEVLDRFASSETAGYLRTLGLITYPLYLIHNVVGSAIIRVLVDAGLDSSLAVAAGLGIVVLVCWFICTKIEPAIRRLLGKVRLAELSGRPEPLRCKTV